MFQIRMLRRARRDQDPRLRRGPLVRRPDLPHVAFIPVRVTDRRSHLYRQLTPRQVPMSNNRRPRRGRPYQERPPISQLAEMAITAEPGVATSRCPERA